jgi:AcrR family transcriptional regulator
MSTNPLETRSRILDAVMQLIVDEGVKGVTLSAVCRRAGISKGGLVHYFPSKEGLIEAFIDRAGQQYQEMIETAFQGIAVGAGNRGLALIDLFVNNQSLRESKGNDDCAAVMLALIQSDRRTNISEQLFDRVFKLLTADGLSADLATTLLVSIDGLWLQSMIEKPDVLQKRANRLRRHLKQLIQLESTRTDRPDLLSSKGCSTAKRKAKTSI